MSRLRYAVVHVSALYGFLYIVGHVFHNINSGYIHATDMETREIENFIVFGICTNYCYAFAIGIDNYVMADTCCCHGYSCRAFGNLGGWECNLSVAYQCILLTEKKECIKTLILIHPSILFNYICFCLSEIQYGVVNRTMQPNNKELF